MDFTLVAGCGRLVVSKHGFGSRGWLTCDTVGCRCRMNLIHAAAQGAGLTSRIIRVLTTMRATEDAAEGVTLESAAGAGEGVVGDVVSSTMRATGDAAVGVTLGSAAGAGEGVVGDVVSATMRATGDAAEGVTLGSAAGAGEGVEGDVELSTMRATGDAADGAMLWSAPLPLGGSRWRLGSAETLVVWK
jgi:hypothetical protein